MAVVLALFLYSQRDVTDGGGKKGGRRTEIRTRARVRVEVSRLAGPPVRETAATENVSHHGLRVRTTYDWTPGNMAMVRFLYEDVSVRARIVYCDPLADSFAVGLQFATAIDLWLPPTVRPGTPHLGGQA
jgi:PilZ domain